MKIRWSLLLAVCLGLLPAFRLAAHPYASGITNSSGTIIWILNEPATDVKIIFDNGKTTNDLGSTPAVGTNSFVLGTHTNFSISVFKVGNGVVSQSSSDATTNNNFFAPRGVVVNRNPKAWNFGRIYVANADKGPAGVRPTSTKGIYVMDAASDDIFNRGNYASFGAMTLGTNTTYSPYKLGIGPDDALYVGDGSSEVIAGVWATDPTVVASTNLFALANPSTNKAAFGTNFGRSIGTPNVTGTKAGGNLVLTLTAWDLDLVNPPGTYAPGANGYQSIYQYNIGSGPLPCTSYPSVIVNPISIGTVNGVKMDAQVAPDGKYFIVADRNYPGTDASTNVCVVDKTGTTTLWDSRSQTVAYFGDLNYDHLNLTNDFCIAVSPDDQYILIDGFNNSFALMALTNGVPDISTLTTNYGSGSGSYSAAWDAADNIYVTSASAETLRIFSLELTSTTCTTSNDFTGTNGGFKMVVGIPGISVSPANQTGECGGEATFNVTAGGYSLAYQWSLNRSPILGATNSSLSLTNLTLSQSGGSYSVMVTNALGFATSQVAVLTVVDTTAPVPTLNNSAITNLAQGTPFTDPGATAADICAGSVPVTVAGTVNVNVGGIYILTYIGTDPSHNSASITRTVNIVATNGPPEIVQQPVALSVECITSASFSATVGGVAPLSCQWFFGTTPLTNGATISGATATNLILNNVSLSEAGGYSVVITNGSGKATSQVAVLTVNDTTPPVITVLGNTSIGLLQNNTFTDPGATASDTCAGALTVTTIGSVNTKTSGNYTLTYKATDPSGNSATSNRLVVVIPPLPSVTAVASSIIPLPSSIITNSGVFTLCPSEAVAGAPSHPLMTILVDPPSLHNGQFLANTLFKSTGYRFPVVTNSSAAAVKHSILLTTVNVNTNLGSEGYSLTVAPDSVVIQAFGEAGVFYGIQSFLQLLPPQAVSQHAVTGVAWTAPCVVIQDQPRFGWRGVMLDVARHFFTKQEVKTVMDALAFHKINTLQLHLCDDQGWRVEITNYPALTTIGAWRGSNDYNLNPLSNSNTNSVGQYGGFYTQSDIRELVAYGQERYITIVPEIEIPAHSTAALASYPLLGTGDAGYDMDSIDYGISMYSLAGPGSQAFFQEVLTEVMQMFPSQYIHCGGDEVIATGDTQWLTYSYDETNMIALGFTNADTDLNIEGYQYWLSTNLASFLQSSGRTMVGWTEFDAYSFVTNAVLMDWQWATPMEAVAATEAGQKVVLCPGQYCYINYVETTNSSNKKAEGGNPVEPYFIVGGSPSFNSVSNLYSWEPTNQIDPTNASLVLGAQINLWTEYVPSGLNVLFKMFPRACAISEIGWTAATNRNYSNFTNRLVTQEQRLAQMGINYDHESLVAIGSWSSATVTATYPATNTLATIDISTNVTAAGEVDIRFWYTSGSDALAVTSVTLLENGTPIDTDTHFGQIGDVTNPDPVYVLHLHARRAGASYTIQVVAGGDGGTDSNGTIYMANWN